MASVYYSILDAVKTRLETIPGIPPVDLRYDLQVYEDETVPLVIVAPGPEFEKRGKTVFSKGQWWIYPVVTGLAWPGNQTVSKKLDEFMDLRETIRDELFQVTLPGVEQVFDTNTDPKAVSKFVVPLNSNYRTTSWINYYTTSEQRKS